MNLGETEVSSPQSQSAQWSPTNPYAPVRDFVARDEASQFVLDQTEDSQDDIKQRAFSYSSDGQKEGGEEEEQRND